MRAIPRSHRTLTRCLVCGFAEVKTDEVFEGGLVLLGECPRCEHRFTRALPERRVLQRVAPPARRGPGQVVAA